MEVFGTGEDQEFSSETIERLTNGNTDIHTDGERIQRDVLGQVFKTEGEEVTY